MTDRKIYCVDIIYELDAKAEKWSSMYAVAFIEDRSSWNKKVKHESSESINGLAKIIANNAKENEFHCFGDIEIMNNVNLEIGENRELICSDYVNNIGYISDNQFKQAGILQSPLELRDFMDLVLKVRNELVNNK